MYSTAYVEPLETIGGDAIAEVTATYDKSMEQQIEFENFFQFANYTNTKRKIGKTEDGDIIKAKSYNPSLDFRGPSFWLPL